jgi:hypothetical protein
MKFAIDVASRSFVFAQLEMEGGPFVCPQCGTYIYLKQGREGRTAYFTHARGVARDCTHTDKDLFPILVQGDIRENVEHTEGWRRYFRRAIRRKH